MKGHNIKSTAASVKKLKKAILDRMNPFQNDLDKNKIFNISSVRAALDQVASFLLDIENFGDKKERNLLISAVKMNHFLKNI